MSRLRPHGRRRRLADSLACIAIVVCARAAPAGVLARPPSFLGRLPRRSKPASELCSAGGRAETTTISLHITRLIRPPSRLRGPPARPRQQQSSGKKNPRLVRTLGLLDHWPAANHGGQIPWPSAIVAWFDNYFLMAQSLPLISPRGRSTARRWHGQVARRGAGHSRSIGRRPTPTFAYYRGSASYVYR